MLSAFDLFPQTDWIFKKNVSIDKEITPSASFKMCLTVLLATNFYRNVYIIK